MTLLAELAIKVSVLIGAALATTVVLRHRSAALRHWCLAAAMAAALALPAVQSLMPAWRVWPTDTSDVAAVPHSTTVTTEFRIAASAMAASSGDARIVASPQPWFSIDRVVVAGAWLWAFGVVVSVSILVIGLARLILIGRESRAFDHPVWHAILFDICDRYGIAQRVRLRTVDHPGFLFTWGVRRPVVLLPGDAASWSIDRARVVLAHELAHIVRADWAIQLLAEAVRAANWFNPLVWIACRRLRAESEHACDDAVIASGVSGADYATELLELARTLAAKQTPWVPAPAMARPSSLEGRVTAMLNANVNRRPIARSTRIAVAAVLLLTIAGLAGVTAQGQIYSTYSGMVTDQTGGFIPGGTLQLVNEQSGAKYEIKTSSTGTFEFVGLPSGEYTLKPLVPGFQTTPSRVTIAGRNVRGDLKLQVGTLEETVTVHDVNVDPFDYDRLKEAMVAVDKLSQARSVQRAAPAQPACTPVAGGMGGNIKQPTKVADKRPIFPEALRGTQASGVVKLDAVIGVDGRIRDARVVASSQPAFDQPAVDAVMQWAFTPTLLNCTAIEVGMTVTVRFDAE